MVEGLCNSSACMVVFVVAVLLLYGYVRMVS